MLNEGRNLLSQPNEAQPKQTGRNLLNISVEEIKPPQELTEEQQRATDIYNGLGITDAAKSIGASALGALIGGYKGIGELISTGDPSKVAQAVEQTQQDWSRTPESTQGQFIVDGVAKAGEFGQETVNTIASGLTGLASLARTQDPSIAAQEVEMVKKDGLGPALGDEAIDRGYSPEVATALDMAGETAGALFGQRKFSAHRNNAHPTSKEIAIDKTKQGSTDADTAKYMLEPQQSVNYREGSVKTLQPQVISNPFYGELTKQGFDKGIIPVLRQSSKADISKYKKMVDIMEEGHGNLRKGALNRPSDVVGDTLQSRITVIKDMNKQAGKAVDVAATSLKGQKVNFDPVVKSFVETLNKELGVKLQLTDNGVTFNFNGSAIEGVNPAINLINDLAKRMKGSRNTDAFAVHELKRFIDEKVAYGKNADGLTGRTEGIIKKLRHNLDEILDNQFPDYDMANTAYSETIRALNNIQDIAGKRIDIYGPNSDKALGTLTRRLTGNAQSRQALLNSANEIENILRKNNIPIDDDLIGQLVFSNELDRVFGDLSQTSFRAEVSKGIGQAEIPTNARDLGLNIAQKGWRRVRNINDEQAYKAIRDYLTYMEAN